MRKNLYTVRKDADHGRIHSQPLVMNKRVQDGFVESLVIKKRNILPFRNAAPFICLDDVDGIAVFQNFIHRIQNTGISVFLDRKERISLALATKNRNTNRNVVCIRKKQCHNVVAPISSQEPERLFESFLVKCNALRPIIHKQFFKSQFLRIIRSRHADNRRFCHKFFSLHKFSIYGLIPDFSQIR